MATFVEELASYQRRDGTRNIRIALHHNGETQYIGTNLYVGKEDVTKSKTIKDNIILDSIQQQKKALRDICNAMGGKLNEMSCSELKQFLERKISGKRETEKPIDIIEHLEKDHERLLAIAKKKKGEKARSSTADSRRTAANSLKAFTKSNVLDVNLLTTNFVMSYIDWMKGDKAKLPPIVKKNTETIGKALNELKYKHNDEDNRIIRITVNPFEKIKQGRKIGAIDHQFEKHKQSIVLDVATIQKMIDQKTFDNRRELFSRDMFLLSFVLVGINTADLYSCSGFSNGIIAYNRQKVEERRKDNALFKIRVEPEVLPLFEKYKNADFSKKEVFNFYEKHISCDSFSNSINGGLEFLQEKIGIGKGEKFTQYSARRSWATIARNVAKVDKYTVHEALNHTDKDIAVTDLYIEKDFSLIWEANRKVLNLFDWTNITENLATHEVCPPPKKKKQ